MDLIALYRLVTDHFGSKAAHSEIESGRGVVNVVLYETFIFTCNVNDQHGGFATGSWTGTKQVNVLDNHLLAQGSRSPVMNPPRSCADHPLENAIRNSDHKLGINK